MQIAATQSHRDIRIFINNTLHLIIPREDGKVVPLQAYISGKQYFVDVGGIEVCYDNREMWEQVLKLLNEMI